MRIYEDNVIKRWICQNSHLIENIEWCKYIYIFNLAKSPPPNSPLLFSVSSYGEGFEGYHGGSSTSCGAWALGFEPQQPLSPNYYPKGKSQKLSWVNGFWWRVDKRTTDYFFWTLHPFERPNKIEFWYLMGSFCLS